MSGHTPGPWIYDSGSFYAAIQLGEDGMTYEATIIDMGGGRPDDHQANARLVAAAPTMHEYITKRADAGDSEAKQILESINAGR